MWQGHRLCRVVGTSEQDSVAMFSRYNYAKPLLRRGSAPSPHLPNTDAFRHTLSDGCRCQPDTSLAHAALTAQTSSLLFTASR